MDRFSIINESFIDDCEELQNQTPDTSDITIDDAYKFTLYCGSSVDITSTTPDGHKLLEDLQKRMNKFIALIDMLGVDYYWDEQMYINRESYIKAFPEDEDKLVPIGIHTKDSNSLSLYACDMCAGFRVLFNPMMNVRTAIEFFYGLSNMFDLYGQYAVHNITFTHQRKYAFTYFGLFNHHNFSNFNITKKQATIFLDEILESGIIKQSADFETLYNQFVKYINITRTNFKFKVIE